MSIEPPVTSFSLPAGSGLADFVNADAQAEKDVRALAASQGDDSFGTVIRVVDIVGNTEISILTLED